MTLKKKADEQQGGGKRAKMEEMDDAGGASTPSSTAAVPPSDKAGVAGKPTVAASGASTASSDVAEQQSVTANGASTPSSTAAEPPSDDAGVAGKSTVAASCASKVKQQTLGISAEEPPLPSWPTEDEIIGGTAPPLIDFMAAMTKNVYWRLSSFLFDEESLSLRMPLYTQRTPPFRAKRGSAPSTFKEPLNLDNCIDSLKCSGLYEGSITAWQFAACQKKWNGIDLGIDKITFKNVEACDGLWTKAALAASASNPDHERMIFPSFIPTAVESTVLVREMIKKVRFS